MLRCSPPTQWEVVEQLHCPLYTRRDKAPYFSFTVDLNEVIWNK